MKLSLFLILSLSLSLTSCSFTVVSKRRQSQSVSPVPTFTTVRRMNGVDSIVTYPIARRRLGLPQGFKDVIIGAGAGLVNTVVNCLIDELVEKGMGIVQNIPLVGAKAGKLIGPAAEGLKKTLNDLIHDAIANWVNSWRRRRRMVLDIRSRRRMFDLLGGIGSALTAVKDGLVATGNAIVDGATAAGNFVKDVSVGAFEGVKTQMSALAERLGNGDPTAFIELLNPFGINGVFTKGMTLGVMQSQGGPLAELAKSYEQQDLDARRQFGEQVKDVVVKVQNVARKIDGLTGGALSSGLANWGCPILKEALDKAIAAALATVGYVLGPPACMMNAIENMCIGAVKGFFGAARRALAFERKIAQLRRLQRKLR